MHTAPSRTAVERANGRLKVFWGADDGNLSGARRFRAFVGVVMVVHAGFATLLARAPHKGTLGKLHLGPVQKEGYPPPNCGPSDSRMRRASPGVFKA